MPTGNTQQIIDYGASANDGTGDPLRVAFIKTDENFDNIWLAGPVGSNVRITNNTISAINTNGNIILQPNGVGIVQANAHVIPSANNIRDLGSVSSAWRRAYINDLYLQAVSVAGDAVIDGNLVVEGNVIQMGSIVTDSLTIQLANTAANGLQANGAGITVGANDDIATFLYDSSNNVWTTNIGISAGGPITGTSLAVSEATIYGNLNGVDGYFTGNVTADYFIGNGSLLTNIDANNINGLANVAYTGDYNDLINTPDFGNLTGDITTTGNIAGNYFIGNGSLLTGITSYANANAVAYGESGWAGNIIPSANNYYTLGNSTNQWESLYVSNTTIYINNVPIGLTAGNVLTVGGEPILSNDSNTTISTTGNITSDRFFGNLTLPTEGNILGVTLNNSGSLQWVGNSSGDGFGYTTLRLIPDDTVTAGDQYLIIDPTAGGHIHIRAGGTQDNSFGYLYLGGENSYFQVPAGSNPSVYVAADNNVWTFNNDGVLDVPGNITVNSSWINNLSDPVNAQDAATKNYVDTVAQGLHIHNSCNVATTEDLATYTGATVSYDNGAGGVGATLTFSGNTLTTIDGVSLASQDRILVKDEANAVFNGIYVYSNATALTRATDFDSDSEGLGGDFVFVTSGNVNADTGWVQTTDAPSIGNSNIVWQQFSAAGSYTANTAAGLVLNGSQFNAKVDGVTTAFDLNGNITVKAGAALTTPNIDAATGTSLSVTGNVSAAYFIGDGSQLTGLPPGYTDADVATFLAAYGSNTISTTGNITAGNFIGSGTNVDIVAGSYDWTFDSAGTLTLPGNTFAVNYANGTAVSLGGNYNDSNVATLLAAFGSNTISTTGNVTASYFFGNGSQLTAVNAVTADVTNTNGLTTVYYPTFVESRTTGQILRADTDLSYRTDTNTLTAGRLTVTASGTAINAGSGDILTNQVTGTQFNFLNGLYTVNLNAGQATANYALRLPANAGTNGQTLTTDGTGNLSWSTAAGSYGNSNVATFLAAYGSNTISTTGNITAGNLIGNISITGNVTGTSPNVTLIAGSYSTTFDNTGNVTLANSNVFVGVTNTVLPNTVASFSSNVNSYTQVTFQNKNAGADATADFILTADNGSDTVNYGDFGIINSGYDVNTPTNSLGNIVRAGDTYIYAQGNVSNTSQSGGNLVLGTTVANKYVKIFAGGNTASALVANISNTGISVTGNVTATNFIGNVSLTGNIQGTSANVELVAGSYTFTFDNTGIMTLPAVGGDEGGEINFGIPAANTTLTSPVKLDVYQDRIRFFDGSTKGAYIDMSQAGTGVSTLLNNRVSGYVNAGTYVTMDNLKATVSTAGNRSLQIATVSGSYSVYVNATYTLFGGGTAGTGATFTLTTTPTLAIAWNFTAQGDTVIYIINDITNSRTYRVTMMIGPSYNNNLISIERLI